MISLSNMAGDGSLQNIQQEAMTLLRVVLSCPIGAQRAVYDYQGGKSYSKLLALKRKEEELYAKCVEVEAEINLLKGDKQTFDAVEDRTERIEQLKMEITDVKTKHYQDTLLLDLLKKSQCANKMVFSLKHSELDTPDDLRSILEQQSEVVTELIKNFKEVEIKRTEIDNIRTQRSMLQNECRKLMSHLQQESVQKSSSEDTETQAVLEMKEKLEEVTSHTILLQHTLQALIGGYTNWAADEELHEFLISLGTAVVP